jgi:hypothetical protein
MLPTCVGVRRDLLQNIKGSNAMSIGRPCAFSPLHNSTSHTLYQVNQVNQSFLFPKMAESQAAGAGGDRPPLGRGEIGPNKGP